jgi:hypothetical protein
MTRTSIQLLTIALALLPLRAAAGDLDDLDFMTGVWRGAVGSAVVEEWWMPAHGGAKVAAFRWAEQDRVAVIELVIISEEADGTFLRFKHYGVDFVPWEKDEPNVYRLVAATDGEAVFERVSENERVPKGLIYSRTEGGLRFRGTNHAGAGPSEKDLVLDFQAVEAR